MNRLDILAQVIIFTMLVLVLTGAWADRNAYWLMGIGVGIVVRDWLSRLMFFKEAPNA